MRNDHVDSGQPFDQFTDPAVLAQSIQRRADRFVEAFRGHLYGVRDAVTGLLADGRASLRNAGALRLAGPVS